MIINRLGTILILVYHVIDGPKEPLTVVTRFKSERTLNLVLTKSVSSI